MSAFEEAVKKYEEMQDFINTRLDDLERENQALNKRWDDLKVFLKEKTSMHCSEPRHYQDKSLFMDVVVKMDELEERK